MSLFTHEQYNQILKMLSKGKGKEVDSMANVATASSSGTSGTFTTLMSDMAHTNWIIDTGASNHMVHCMNLMKHCTDLEGRIDMKVNLPTGAQVAISHVGDSLILKDKLVKDVLYILDFQYNLLSVSQLTKQLKCAVLFSLTYVSFRISSVGGSWGLVRKIKDYIFSIHTYNQELCKTRLLGTHVSVHVSVLLSVLLLFIHYIVFGIRDWGMLLSQFSVEYNAYKMYL